MADEHTPEPHVMTNAEGLQKARKLMLNAVAVIDAHEIGRCVWWEMAERSLRDVARFLDRYYPPEPERSFVRTCLNDALAVIRDHAFAADVKAQVACMKSRYSMQDYHLCVEFAMQQLHDELAKKFKLAARCPKFPFRQKVDELRCRTAAEVAAAPPSTATPDLEA